MLAKINRALGKLLYTPRPTICRSSKLARLGSEYGGWTFRMDDSLRGSTIVSAGLGEDASFDVEFASTFGARVIIVDPTPRSITHYQTLVARAGTAQSCGYVAGGNQPVEAYPLEAVTPDQLVLEPKALWTKSTVLRFYKPPNPAHVSHSITNFQNGYSADGEAIEVASTTLPAILEKHGVGTLQLLKLDIEGAEIDVLSDMLEHNIRPMQLLVEYDELLLRTRTALQRWRQMHQRLGNEGYECLHFDGRSCFLYVQPIRQ